MDSKRRREAKAQGWQGKQVFTMGEVAELCNVAIRTASKWFDTGRLKGYRVPGALDRRVPRANLIRFLRDHGMPLGLLEVDERAHVLIVGYESAALPELQAAVAARITGGVHVAGNAFEAGMLAKTVPLRKVLISMSMGRTDGLLIAAALRAEVPDAHLLAVLNDDEPDLAEIRQVFHGWMRRPVHLAALVDFLTAPEMPDAAHVEALAHSVLAGVCPNHTEDVS